MPLKQATLKTTAKGQQTHDAGKFARFVFVGVSSSLVFVGLTWLFVDGLHLHVTLGSTIAFVLTSLYNYTLHYYWTFTSNTPHGWVLVKYLIMLAGAAVVNALTMHFGVMFLPIHYLLIQVLSNLAVTLWSFCLSSLWVFKNN